MRHITRRDAISLGAAATASAVVPVAVCSPQDDRKQSYSKVDFPHHEPKYVQEVVRFSHFNLDAVREIVEARPALAKSAWDWGFGDWESALGAASHMGNREIAQLLIKHGARPNLFTFAMLGNLEVVRATIKANPGIQRIYGPHCISLLNHARAGGEESLKVVEYLETLGDADPRLKNDEIDEADIKRIVGTYQLSGSQDDRYKLQESRGRIVFKWGEEFGRTLFHQGELEFCPAGAPSVRFRFSSLENETTILSIIDGKHTFEFGRVDG